MSNRPHIKSKIKTLNPVFHKREKSEDANELSQVLIKSAKRTGKLVLSGKGLTTVPDKVWRMLDSEPETIDLCYSKERSVNEDAWWTVQSLTILDLSSNCLTVIPPDIENLMDLSTLNLQDNALVSLPNEIKHLTKLQRLNLCHNKLAALPDGLFSLPDLRALNVSYNCLEILTPAIGDLVMLELLDLSNNNLTSLPPGMGFLTRITQLNLSNNKLKELPPDIVNLRVLLKLDITNNELESLPPSMGELRKMELLYAQHNNINKLPDFTGCLALKEIFLGNNYIKEITQEFCESLPHLQILDLRDNKIDTIPEDVSMLQSLTRLNLTNNSLTGLPSSMSTLSHLQSLQLDGNSLRSIGHNVIQRGTAGILKSLRAKAVEPDNESAAALKESHKFPDRYAMKASRSLALPGRELTSIPDVVLADAEIAEVTVVDLSKNKLKIVPDRLASLYDTLSELNLSSNLLTDVPGALGTLKNLQFLELSKNSISGLPAEISQLKFLRELVISNNRFTSIPDCVYALESLEILLVRDNRIENINISSGPNGGLSALKRLTVLDLSNNNISFVPPELGNLLQIRTLDLLGNAFRQPRNAILSRGTATIMSYLRDRIPE